MAGQALALAFSSALSQALVAVMYIVTARLTGPRSLGLIASSVALAMTIAGLVDFGSNSLWIRELARGAMSPPELARRLAGKGLLALAVAAVALLVSLVSGSDPAFWAVGPILVAFTLGQMAQVPLRGVARSGIVSVSVVVDRLVAAAAFGLALLLSAPATTALAVGFTLGPLAAAVLCWTSTPGDIRPRLQLRRVTNPYRASGYYGLVTVANNLQSIDTAVLGAVGGPLQAGLYAAVNRWTQPLGLLVSAFSSASVPFVARSRSWREAWQHIATAIWLPILAVVACVVVAAIAPLLVPFLLGGEYAQAAGILQILALAVVPAIISQPLSSFLLAAGKDREVAYAFLVVVVVQLAALVLSARFLGATGAAWAFAAGQVLMMGCLAAILWRARFDERAPAPHIVG